MSIIPIRKFAIILMAALATKVGGPLAADRAASRQDADQMRRKILLIGQNGLSSRPAARRTPVSEGEVNAFLAFDAKEQLPQGVVDPYVGILGDGRLSGRATVDLDAVRRDRSSGSYFDPLSYLTGRLPVSAIGVLHSKNGVGQFDLESAEISGITVPKPVLQQLLTYYSRTKENPDGISLDEPFELPAKIRHIEVGKGQAIVVQ